MKEFIISEELTSAVFNYLMARPMREVEGLVGGLRQMPTLVRPEPMPEVDSAGKPQDV